MGYQEIRLYDSNQNVVNRGKEAYEYGGSGAASTQASWIEFKWYVEGYQCTDSILIGYNAHGGMGDKWKVEEIRVSVEIIKIPVSQ
jgi:hypothetical protein